MKTQGKTLSGDVCGDLVKFCIELEDTEEDGLKDGIMSSRVFLYHYTVPGVPSFESKMLQSPLQAETSHSVRKDLLQWIDVTILAAAVGLRP